MPLEIRIPMNDKELSQRKLEEYAKFERIIQAGRMNPIWFTEYMFGLKLIDYQAWQYMKSWVTKYVLWLASRGGGKTSTAGIFLMGKMLLIPSSVWYISTNSALQSIEVFKKIEDISFKRVPSFRTVTDLFREEVYRTSLNQTGFKHDPGGHTFSLYNNSEITTLSTNLAGIRGKRGSVLFDETAWQTVEQMRVVENYANVDSEFSLGTGNQLYQVPKNVPIQLIYASSAGDVEYPFFDKYKSFAFRMFMGDKDYFVCDININTVLHHSTVNGKKIKSHISMSSVEKAIEEDPEGAERELYNRFRKGVGLNGVVKMEDILSSSVVMKPVLQNDDGKRKFILCYDPARAFDGSILGIFEVIEDKDIGTVLRFANMISMVDTETDKKTPLPMNLQLEKIKKTMIKYNGEKAADWENIEFWIDAGSGGGGISAVADQLLEDWVDETGRKRRGIIDPDHKQYVTARARYTNAVPIVHLIEPTSHKKLIFDALEKMMRLHLITLPAYDNKDVLTFLNEKGEFVEYLLEAEEKMALTQSSLMINEVSYMVRYDNANGSVSYELSRDRANKMHDDRAYVMAMAAYALSTKRRSQLFEEEKEEVEDLIYYRPHTQSRWSSQGGGRHSRR